MTVEEDSEASEDSPPSELSPVEESEDSPVFELSKTWLISEESPEFSEDSEICEVVEEFPLEELLSVFLFFPPFAIAVMIMMRRMMNATAHPMTIARRFGSERS